MRVLAEERRSVHADRAQADGLDLHELAGHPAVRVTGDQSALESIQRNLSVHHAGARAASGTLSRVVGPGDPLALTLDTVPPALQHAHFPQVALVLSVLCVPFIKNLEKADPMLLLLVRLTVSDVPNAVVGGSRAPVVMRHLGWMEMVLTTI
jgi:hypothetical protein